MPRPISDRLGYWLIKRINKANRDFDLISEGDRIVVAVSGGKDSLTLLELLHRRLRSVPTSYTLVPVHVVSDWRCTDQSQRSHLEEHFRSLGLEYAFPEIKIVSDEGSGRSEPGCFWCAWNRRKSLFKTAHALQCNKVAFGHHSDDIAQTTLLNLFYQGRLGTMEPKMEFFEGVITVIRPMVYVQEKEIVRFTRAAGFPLAQTTCPHAATSKRAKMAQLLRQIEAECPKVKTNLFRAALGGNKRKQKRASPVRCAAETFAECHCEPQTGHPCLCPALSAMVRQVVAHGTEVSRPDPAACLEIAGSGFSPTPCSG